MKSFFSIFKMDFSNLFKNPVLVGFNTIFPIAMILILGYLCGGNYSDIKYAYQYYAVATIVFGMLEGAMTATNCFMERDIKKPNLRIIFSPAGNFQIYFSKILASFLFDYILHALLAIIFCPIFGVTLGTHPVLFIILMAPVEFVSAALGVFFCCLLHSEEASSTLLSNIISLFAILGGTFFSLEGMGSTIAYISRFSPVKWLNNVFFALSCDNNEVMFWPVFFSACAISALLILGCRLTFRSEDYL